MVTICEVDWASGCGAMQFPHNIACWINCNFLLIALAFLTIWIFSRLLKKAMLEDKKVIDLGFWKFELENPRDWFILGLIILLIFRITGVLK